MVQRNQFLVSIDLSIGSTEIKCIKLNTKIQIAFFSGCSSGRWKCSSEDKCIPNAWRCDGKYTDCVDTSDEQFCGKKGASLDNLKERPFDQM